MGDAISVILNLIMALAGLFTFVAFVGVIVEMIRGKD